MTKLFIHVMNSTFESRDDGADYQQPQDAMDAGVKSAMKIITDEVETGLRSAAVDVCILAEDKKTVLRSVVAVSVAPMMVRA